MINEPSRWGDQPPEDLASVPPNLRPTTGDVRMVMIELGKLGAKVDRLIADVEKHDAKLESLNSKAAMIQGGLIVVGALIAFLSWLIPQLVGGKVAALIQTAAAAHK